MTLLELTNQVALSNWAHNSNKCMMTLQSFAGIPSVFVSAKYTRDTKPDDAMYIWPENVKTGSFEVCIREFFPFDGKHQDTVVVRTLIIFYYFYESV